MKALFLSILTVLVSANAFAQACPNGVCPLRGAEKKTENVTKGVEDLKIYDCTLITDSGEIEGLYPIGKSLFAASKSHAIAMYLMHFDAVMTSKKVSITYQVKANEYKNDTVKEVLCEKTK